MKKNHLPVSETFYSIQGEGITSGVPAVFLRLGGCNLMCGGNGTQINGELHNGATWRCMDENTFIETKDGLKRMKYVEPGDFVQSIKPNHTKTIIWDKVIRSQSTGIKSGFEVGFSNGKKLILSHDHKLFSKAGKHYRIKNVSGLVVGDKVKGKTEIKDLVKNKDWYCGYILGALDGDGHIQKQTFRYDEGKKRERITPVFVFQYSNCDVETVIQVKESIKVLFDYDVNIKQSNRKTVKGRTVWKFGTSKKEIIEFLHSYKLTEKNSAGYVAAMVDTEGYSSKHELRISQKTDSIHAIKIEKSLDDVGVPYVIRTNNSGMNDYCISSGDRSDFLNRTGFVVERKINPILETSVSVLDVVSINEVKELKSWQIETELSGKYFAGGILHKNCDTIEIWMKSKQTEFKDIIPGDQIQKLRYGAHLIITGGEPLLHQEEIVEFIHYIYSQYHFFPFVEVETNGTIMPNAGMKHLVQQWNVSPKLSNSGNWKETRFDRNVLETISKWDQRDDISVQFKFVINKKDDYSEILDDFHFIPVDQLVLMPSGEDQDLLNQSRKDVAELCIEFMIRYSDRLHIVIWNQKTGV